MAVVNNPFMSRVAARMYAAGRPDYSLVAGAIIRKLTGIETPVRYAVDVGCGTGISTKTLAAFARRIVGVERSSAMLEQAMAIDGVSYVIGAAEALPLEDGSCDLIGVGSAFHWFDRERFVAEASRVAAPGAWLAVHNHWFVGEMDGVAEFGEWVRDTYLMRYPPAPRDRSWGPPADLGPWRHVAWEPYDHVLSMAAAQLVRYLMTQSNIQVVLERGDEAETDIADWLHGQVAPFFATGTTGTFAFGGYVACHQHADT